MTKKVLDVQCPNCGAPLHFNAKLGKMKCDYCDNVYDPEYFKMDNNEESNDSSYVVYNCPDCGAEIIADEQTSATFCLYCGNTAILKNKLSGEFRPSKLIPFKVEKKQAIEAFKKLKKGKPFMPKSFCSEKNIEKITGLYVPFWLYEIYVSGDINVEGVKVTSWSSGDTHYTKRDYYNVIREGNMEYNRVPVDGSTRFDNDIMNSIEPFDYNYLVDFNHAYLSGYLAEKYDVDNDSAFINAEKRTLNSSEEIMLKDITSYTTKVLKSKSLKVEKTNYEYALLPVWMVNVKYNGKYYIFAMNGQTGKFIGNIPLDKKKVVIYSVFNFISIFILTIIITYIIYLFTGGNI